MNICHRTEVLRKQVTHWKQQGLSVALVPTMGNLHAGHLSLVTQAQQEADKVVVSIFVNPTQFGPNEDFDSYPRTLEQDCDKLEQINTDLVFAPTVDIVYPQKNLAWVDIELLGDTLCGANRPGHFRGVCTVVAKLFNLVQPDVACFGQKDYQQLAIIRRMASDLCFPIRIIGVPISRSDSGLALSSRNNHLSAKARANAALLQQQLQSLKTSICAGERDYTSLSDNTRAYLTDRGFDVDYISVMNADTLQPASPADTHLLVALAARLESTRLIDNVSFLVETR